MLSPQTEELSFEKLLSGRNLKAFFVTFQNNILDVSRMSSDKLKVMPLKTMQQLMISDQIDKSRVEDAFKVSVQ